MVVDSGDGMSRLRSERELEKRMVRQRGGVMVAASSGDRLDGIESVEMAWRLGCDGDYNMSGWG